MNKKAGIKLRKNILLIFLVLSLFILNSFFPQASAGKLDQEYIGNKTCELSTDDVLWNSVGTKAGVDNDYYNWSIGTDCSGTKNCDMVKIENYVRYINIGDKTPTSGGLQAYVQIGNSSQSLVGTTQWLSLIHI